MFLSNSDTTIQNLIVYSSGNYMHRTIQTPHYNGACIKCMQSWGTREFYAYVKQNVWVSYRPYGNIGKVTHLQKLGKGVFKTVSF